VPRCSPPAMNAISSMIASGKLNQFEGWPAWPALCVHVLQWRIVLKADLQAPLQWHPRGSPVDPQSHQADSQEHR
jgi:hypothetical protein